MRESHAEMKAIEAQLRSIRADSRSANLSSRHSTSPTPSHRSPTTTRSNATPVQQNYQPRSTSYSQPAHVQSTRSTAPPSAAPHSLPNPSQNTRIQHYPFLTPSAPHKGFQQEMAATLEHLEQQSAQYIQQFKQFQAQMPQPSEHVFHQSLQVLDTQAQYINQLSAIQETAIQELKMIAEQIEQDWKALEQVTDDATRSDLEPPQVVEYQATAVPQLEKDKYGIYVLTTRAIDLFKAEREASLTAQALRHWSKRGRTHPRAKSGVWAWLVDTLTAANPEQPQSRIPRQHSGHPQPSSRSNPTQSPLSTPTPSTSSGRAVRHRRSRPRQSVSAGFGVRQAVSLVLGAIAVRVALNVVLSAFPVLWTPMIALLATPAAIAVYRTSHKPQSGIVWGYRLLLIMIGLLLGGRL